MSENQECLFCQIVKKKRESYIIAENELVMAILDVFPISDGHVLLVSKKHFANIVEVDEESWSFFLSLLKIVVNELKKTFSPNGFNIISNIGKEAYQSIFHLHIHIIPKYEKDQGFIWSSQPKLKYDLNQVMRKLKH